MSIREHSQRWKRSVEERGVEAAIETIRADVINADPRSLQDLTGAFRLLCQVLLDQERAQALGLLVSADTASPEALPMPAAVEALRARRDHARDRLEEKLGADEDRRALERRSRGLQIELLAAQREVDALEGRLSQVEDLP
jgi:hypothetical protein